MTVGALIVCTMAGSASTTAVPSPQRLLVITLSPLGNILQRGAAALRYRKISCYWKAVKPRPAQHSAANDSTGPPRTGQRCGSNSALTKRGLHPLGRERQVAQALAGRIGDRIGDRRHGRPL